LGVFQQNNGLVSLEGRGEKNPSGSDGEKLGEQKKAVQLTIKDNQDEKKRFTLVNTKGGRTRKWKLALDPPW